MLEDQSHPAPPPTLSIALCTYEGARHLDEQLATMLDQTVAPTELVVCDDRSNDDSVARLSAFAARVPFPVRVHINPHRLGAARNFSDCIARCTGDVVVLTDQDDLWMPDRLERTQNAFASNPALSYTFSDAPLIDDQGRPIGRTILTSVPILRTDRAPLARGTDLLAIILRYGVLYGATMAVRRADAIKVLPVPPRWSHDEWLSLALAATGRSARLAPVTRYRQHGAQVIGAGDARLATTLQSARNRTAAHYHEDAARQREGLTAALGNEALRASLAPLLAAKLRFVEDRERIHRGGKTAVVCLIRQLTGGGYARFAGGIRSVIKDAMLLASA